MLPTGNPLSFQFCLGGLTAFKKFFPAFHVGLEEYGSKHFFFSGKIKTIHHSPF